MIGITAYAEPSVRWGAWDVPAAVIPLAYVQQVEAAGGRALLVPPSEDGIEETLDVLDGVLFSGGSDIDPVEYGQDAHPETTGTRPERDRGELALLRAALDRDMPVLAVCRGSQVLNVARGGDLVQHLPEVVGDEKHKQTPGVFADHEVDVKEGTRLGSLLGERAPVKSHHHQGFGKVGEGLVESAWADDGTLEALEDPEKRFAVGVLWHPEEGEDGALFRALVDEARAYRAAEALAGDRRRERRYGRRGRRDGAQARRRGREDGKLERLRRGRGDRGKSDRSRRCRLRRRLLHGGTLGRRRPGGERRQELAHPRVVLGDPLLELELQAGLLGHPLVELAARVADHVADQDADDESAEQRREPVAGRNRPGGPERAEGIEPTSTPANAPIATPVRLTARAFAS